MTDSTVKSPEAEFPWEFPATASIHGSVHFITPTPELTTSPEVYPSVTVNPHQDAAANTQTFVLTCNGNAEQRGQLADALRKAADFFEAWIPEDGHEGGGMTAEPPLPPSCTDVTCSWASVPHVHEGDAIYPAPPDDPQWVFALGSDAQSAERSA